MYLADKAWRQGLIQCFMRSLLSDFVGGLHRFVMNGLTFEFKTALITSILIFFRGLLNSNLPTSIPASFKLEGSLDFLTFLNGPSPNTETKKQTNKNEQTNKYIKMSYLLKTALKENLEKNNPTLHF